MENGVNQTTPTNVIPLVTKQSLKVGDILVCQWGYSMIITDFFQIVKVNQASVLIRQIESKDETLGFLHGKSTATKDHFVERAHVFAKNKELQMRRMIKYRNDGTAYVRMSDYSFAHLIEEGRSYTFDHCD